MSAIWKAYLASRQLDDSDKIKVAAQFGAQLVYYF
jgi:hypothetical protein